MKPYFLLLKSINHHCKLFMIPAIGLIGHARYKMIQRFFVSTFIKVVALRVVSARSVIFVALQSIT